MKKSRGMITPDSDVARSWSVWVYTQRSGYRYRTSAEQHKNIKLGLDLEGGVSITYQVKGDKLLQMKI